MYTNLEFFREDGFEITPDVHNNPIDYALHIQIYNKKYKLVATPWVDDAGLTLNTYTCKQGETWVLDSSLPIDITIYLDNEEDRINALYEPSMILQVLRSYATLISVGFFN